MNPAQHWIDRLQLQPHPEGGFFRETYRSIESIDAAALTGGFAGARSVSTAIYFLLRSQDVSRLHRLRSDELWHHYHGSSVTIHVLDPGGWDGGLGRGRDVGAKTIRLKSSLDDAEMLPQAVVPAGCWFGATVDEPETYALVGCTVAPGFDFQDFELGEREALLQTFPEHRELIERLT